MSYYEFMIVRRWYTIFELVKKTVYTHTVEGDSNMNQLFIL